MDLEGAHLALPTHCPAQPLLQTTHLGVIGYQTVLADVDSVFEAKQVCHLPLGTLAKSHDRS